MHLVSKRHRAISRLTFNPWRPIGILLFLQGVVQEMATYRYIARSNLLYEIEDSTSFKYNTQILRKVGSLVIRIY
jgi:hypothetical protein